MFSADHYRREAERCRKFAAERPASEAQQRWLQLADEYERLAQVVAPDARPGARRGEGT